MFCDEREGETGWGEVGWLVVVGEVGVGEVGEVVGGDVSGEDTDAKERGRERLVDECFARLDDPGLCFNKLLASSSWTI